MLVPAASDRDIGVLCSYRLRFCMANMANSKLDSQGFSGQDGHLPASGAVYQKKRRYYKEGSQFRNSVFYRREKTLFGMNFCMDLCSFLTLLAI